jgi:hypothetical protein
MAAMLQSLFTPESCGYFAACVVVHRLTKRVAKPVAEAMGLEFPKHSSSELFNQVVSTYHSALFAIIYFYVWLYSGTQDIVFNDGDAIYKLDHTLLQFMIGYLLYDTVFEIKMIISADGRKTWSGHLQILLHHAMGLLTHGWISHVDSGIAARLMLVIYGAEVSTPFLNVSWMLNHFNMSSGKIFKAVSYMLLVAFTFRLGIGPYVFYCLFSRMEAWSNTIYLFYTVMIVVGIFSFLNFFWYYRLYQRAMSHNKKLLKKGSESSNKKD